MILITISYYYYWETPYDKKTFFVFIIWYLFNYFRELLAFKNAKK